MLQMKVTVSVLLVAAAIAPVVANDFEAEASLVTRDDNELASYFERDFDLELKEREFHDDLFEREPFGGKFMKKAFRMGRKHVTPPETPNEPREFDDDIFEREFEEKLYGRAGGGGGGGHRARPNRREFEEKLYGRAGGGGGGGHRARPMRREFEDKLYGRAGGGGGGGHRARPKRREFEEKLNGRAGGGSGGGHRARPKRCEFTEEPEKHKIRSFDEIEILEREYYDELD